MPAQKIDFKYIRQHPDLDFEKVLSRYGIPLLKDGQKESQYKAVCPFHDDHKPSMKVNLDKKIFNCFACETSGNILDFVMEFDDVSLRTAAKTVAEICGIPTATGRNEKTRSGKEPARKAQKSNSAKRKKKPNRKSVGSGSNTHSERSDPSSEGKKTKANSKSEVLENKPLTFTLKNLITEHEWFEKRGLTPEIIETFNLGIATRGIMADRLAIPIHNQDGELVAYCGRYVGNDIPEDEPKYKLPAGFYKELELYNLNRVTSHEGAIILVESYFSVFKLHMMGLPVASPMGRSLSEVQRDQLVQSGFKSIMLLFDGDDPGRTAVSIVGRQLLEVGFNVTAPVVLTDFKPHRLTEDELSIILRTVPQGLWLHTNKPRHH